MIFSCQRRLFDYRAGSCSFRVWSSTPRFWTPSPTRSAQGFFHGENCCCWWRIVILNVRNPDPARVESRLNFSAKLPHRPPTKVGNFLTSTREIKIFRPNFNKKNYYCTKKSPDVSSYININVWYCTKKSLVLPQLSRFCVKKIF